MKVMESTELCEGRAVYIGKQNKAKKTSTVKCANCINRNLILRAHNLKKSRYEALLQHERYLLFVLWHCLLFWVTDLLNSSTPEANQL